MTNLGLIFLFVLTIVGCTPRTQKPSDQLTVALLSMQSLDWTIERSIQGVTESIAEPLIRYHFVDGKPTLEPAVLLSWQSNGELTQWDCKVRPGLRWSDGTEFRIENIVDAFVRVLDPSIGSNYFNTFDNIKGVKAYKAAKDKNIGVLGIRVLSPDTIRFELQEPASYFPHLLTAYGVAPIRKDRIDKFGKDWILPQNFVGLGPYTVKEVASQRLSVKANPHYYRPLTIKKIEFQVIDKVETAVRLYDSGKVDLVFDLPVSGMERLQKQAGFHSVDRAVEAVLVFSGRSAQAVNEKLRQAIFQSIDRKELARVSLGLSTGGSQDSFHWPAPMAQLPLSTDVKKENFEIAISNKNDRILLAENIQKQLKEKLGITANIAVNDPKYVNELFNQGKTQALLTQIAPEFLAPHFFVRTFTDSDKEWIVQMPTPELITITDQLMRTTDPTEISDLLKEAGEHIAKDAIIVPLFEVPERWLLRPSFTGLRVNHAKHADLSFISTKAQ